MISENSSIKFRLTEGALKIFQMSGEDPKKYITAYDGESAGLDLYNMGEEVVILGRNKWVAFGEKDIQIRTGVKLALPSGKVALIKERSSITKTGLFCRGGVIDPGYTDEICISLVNLGERDVAIPTGCKLPVQIVVLPCFQSFSIVSDLEYLEETAMAKRKSNSLGSSD